MLSKKAVTSMEQYTYKQTLEFLYGQFIDYSLRKNIYKFCLLRSGIGVKIVFVKFVIFEVRNMKLFWTVD